MPAREGVGEEEGEEVVDRRRQKAEVVVEIGEERVEIGGEGALLLQLQFPAGGVR